MQTVTFDLVIYNFQALWGKKKKKKKHTASTLQK